MIRAARVERPAARDRLREAFARDVTDGLSASPKRLPCRWFYDDDGSRLFEAISELPEYYLTRAEREILASHAPSIASRVPRGVTLVELGAGTAAKTRLLIEPLLARERRLRYVPVDICEDALEATTRALGEAYDGLDVIPIAADWEEALGALRSTGPLLVLWLGSSIGNLRRDEAAQFLARVAATIAADARLLCGIDLRKDRATLEAAYDDPAGVTSRFNLNLLARINRELGGHFDLSAFRHRAVYDEHTGRIAMYLVSTRQQRVRIDALGIEVGFDAAETVHTEDSWKYSSEEIDALAAAAGLAIEARWFDRERRFVETLLRRQGDVAAAPAARAAPG